MIPQQCEIFNLKSKTAEKISLDEINKKIDLIIFDFGIERSLDQVAIEFARNVINVQSCLIPKIACGEILREIKVLCISIHNTRYYKSVKKFFNPIQNPYCSGIMVGKIVDNKQLMKSFYATGLMKKISQKIDSSFLLILFLPFVIAANMFVYKLNLLNKSISFRKKRKDSERRIKKLINLKQLVL